MSVANVPDSMGAHDPGPGPPGHLHPPGRHRSHADPSLSHIYFRQQRLLRIQACRITYSIQSTLHIECLVDNNNDFIHLDCVVRDTQSDLLARGARTTGGGQPPAPLIPPPQMYVYNCTANVVLKRYLLDTGIYNPCIKSVCLPPFSGLGSNHPCSPSRPIRL